MGFNNFLLLLNQIINIKNSDFLNTDRNIATLLQFVLLRNLILVPNIFLGDRNSMISLDALINVKQTVVLKCSNRNDTFSDAYVEHKPISIIDFLKNEEGGFFAKTKQDRLEYLAKFKVQEIRQGRWQFTPIPSFVAKCAGLDGTNKDVNRLLTVSCTCTPDEQNRNDPHCSNLLYSKIAFEQVDFCPFCSMLEQLFILKHFFETFESFENFLEENRLTMTTFNVAIYCDGKYYLILISY